MSRNARLPTRSLSRVGATAAGLLLVGLVGCGDGKKPVEPVKADTTPVVVNAAASKVKKNVRPERYKDEDSSAHLRRKNAQAK